MKDLDHSRPVASVESSDPTTHPSSKTGWWTPRLAGPVLAAAVIRAALLAAALFRVGTSAILQNDTCSYLIPGRNLLLHGRFIADGMPDLVRTPGYPLFLALTSLGGLPMAAAAQVILSAFSVLLVWRLGRTVFGDDRIALGAAWIFAFEPLSIVHSVFLLSETLFLTLFLLSMERLAEFLRGRRLPVLAVAGLWLAAATFVRPVTYYLPIALALGLFIVFARVPGLRWKAPAVLLICVLPWLAAWQIRNRAETGYGGFSSIPDIDLYFFNAAEVTARVEHRNWWDVREELGYTLFTNHSGQSYLFQPYLALHPEQSGWSQGQRLAYMHSEGLHVLRAHSGAYLGTCVRDLVMVVFTPGARYYKRLLVQGDSGHGTGIINEGRAGWETALDKTFHTTSLRVAAAKAAFAFLMLGLYLLAARGILLAARGVFRGAMQDACLWLLLGTSLYFLAVAAFGAGPIAEARLRLPVMPAVCIFAAAGFRRAKTSAPTIAS